MSEHTIKIQTNALKNYLIKITLSNSNSVHFRTARGVDEAVGLVAGSNSSNRFVKDLTMPSLT